jgi:hypothetical protein
VWDYWVVSVVLLCLAVRIENGHPDAQIYTPSGSHSGKVSEKYQGEAMGNRLIRVVIALLVASILMLA